MIDGKIERLDKIQIVEHSEGLEIDITEKELQYRFDLFIRSVCSPFAPADSSGRIKTALYKFFENVLKIPDYTFAQKIILSQENNQLFTDEVHKAKDIYKNLITEDVEEQREIQHYVWNVPLFLTYNSRYKETRYNKSILNPSYIKPGSKPEYDFIELIDNPDSNVLWWFKNGESELKYFAISYKDGSGTERAFYVDFIVAMKDGSIGLFDTKSGITAKIAKEKAEALANYIQEQNNTGKNLWGGVVVFKEGSWRYNDSSEYVFDENNLQNDWKFLSFRPTS
jgi:type III restriction enzyme